MTLGQGAAPLAPKCSRTSPTQTWGWRQGKVEMCLNWRCSATCGVAGAQGGCWAKGWRADPHWQGWQRHGGVSSKEQPWQDHGLGQNMAAFTQPGEVLCF